jgi:hypothetical protein
MMLPPKPTFLMLWIARAHAVFVLGLAFTNLVLYSREPDRVVVSGNLGGFGTTGTQVVMHYHSGPTTSLYFTVVLLACLVCGLFALTQRSARLAVSASAMVLIAMSVFGLTHMLCLLIWAKTVAVAFWHVKFPLLLISTFFSVTFQALNIWLALRPPISSRDDDRGGSTFLVHAPII